MLFFNANFICYYFYPTKKREEPKSSFPGNSRVLSLRRVSFFHGSFLFYCCFRFSQSLIWNGGGFFLSMAGGVLKGICWFSQNYSLALSHFFFFQRPFPYIMNIAGHVAPERNIYDKLCNDRVL